MSSPAPRPHEDPSAVAQLLDARELIEAELSSVIVGQRAVIEQLLVALFSGGHCLLTGPPGLAKTLLVKSVAQLFDLPFRRIQFTPDLMPADITGTDIIEEEPGGRRTFHFIPGPIFASVILADEINRTPPKTQAALLEAMQEHQVTAGGERRKLPEPFFVLATQNPIEMEGTYPLPEAQLDRFMFNVVVDYLPEDEELQVVLGTTRAGSVQLRPLYSADDVLRFQQLVRNVPISEQLARWVVQMVQATRPGTPGAAEFVDRWVGWGAGLRAGQFWVLGAKARALLHRRYCVTAADIRALAHPTLRHRILVNYRAEAEGITPEDIIGRLLEAFPAPSSQ